MKRKLSLLISTVAFCAFTMHAKPAAADKPQVTTIGSYGDWTLAQYVTPDPTKSTCVIFTTAPIYTVSIIGSATLYIAENREQNVKFLYSPADTLTTNNSNYLVTLAFSNASIESINTTEAPSNSQLLFSTLTDNQTSIAENFLQSDNVTVSAPGLNSVTLNTSDANDAFTALNNCVSNLNQ